METQPHGRFVLRSVYFIISQNLKPMFKPFRVALSGTEPERLESQIQGGSNMTGTDLCVNKPHCAAAVRP